MLKIFGKEKPCKNVQCLLVSKLYSEFFCPAFSLSSVLQYNVTNTFGKNVNSALQVVKGDSFLGHVRVQEGRRYCFGPK